MEQMNAKFNELVHVLGKDIQLNCQIPDSEALYSVYEQGSIFWNPDRDDAYFIQQDIWSKWISVYLIQPIGYPIEDSKATDDEIGYCSDCEYGSVIWTSRTGAYAVRNDIMEKWISLGGCSALGYPVSDEHCTEKEHFNIFEGGTIYAIRARASQDDVTSPYFRVSLDAQFDHCIDRPFSDPSNFDIWWDSFRPTTVLRGYEDDNLPLRVFDLCHFCEFGRIKFVTPTSWNMFTVVSHTWKEGVPEWYGPKKPWPSNKYMRYWGFSKDDLNLAAKILVALGNRYCWIDNICIDQDSEEEKSREINRMGSFFSNPSTCYVFPNGLGEVEGITQKAPRWYSRVWTMQEVILSKNPTHIYISNDPIGVGNIINVELENGLVATEIRHEDMYDFYKDEPHMAIIWNDNKPTKLEILRSSGCRKSARVEDKIYGVLALLNVTNVDIKYGGGLREAIVSVANAMHIDQRIIMCVAEWAGNEWVDGYCVIPTMIPGSQAWGIDVCQTVGQAYFLGNRGAELTSFMSPAVHVNTSRPIDCWTGRDGCCHSNVILSNGYKCSIIRIKVGQSISTNKRVVGMASQHLQHGSYLDTKCIYESFYRRNSIEPGITKTDIWLNVGFGTLSKHHQSDVDSRIIVIGKPVHIEGITEQLPKSGQDCVQCVVAIVCQRAGDVYHKTGMCVIDVGSIGWTIGRSTLA